MSQLARLSVRAGIPSHAHASGSGCTFELRQHSARASSCRDGRSREEASPMATPPATKSQSDTISATDSAFGLLGLTETSGFGSPAMSASR
eukprot:3717514-Prymnesium_polylepis.2